MAVAIKLKADRSVHPGVRHNDEDSGNHAAEGDDVAGCDMRASGQTIPSVHIKAEENRLREKGEALKRKGHADDPTRPLHEVGPEQSELERQYRARNRAYGEQDGRAGGPSAGGEEKN